MAINHNFKEGIDWASDPTGETKLAGFFFVSKSGSDSTGDGSPQNPYATLGFAVTVVGASDTIIVGAGRYIVEGVNVALKKVIGDGYVVFTGNANGIAQANNGNGDIDGIRCENIVFFNYGEFLPLRGDFGAAPLAYKCLIINCTFGGNIWLGDSIIINTSYQSSSNNIRAYNNLFINSDLICANISAARREGRNNFFDEGSSAIFNDGDVTNNAFNGAVEINTTGTVENNLYNINPAFNNKVGFDLSVNAASELIGAGGGGSNIGGVFIGKGLFQGVAELDSGIDANVNIAYNSLGEIELQAGAAASETFETAEEEALELSVLGATRISGFIDFVNNTPDNNNALVNPNQLILEINVALLDGIYTGWKEYRWNEQPTQNADGTPNGDSSYNWADNNKVSYKKRKYRITVRSDYNQA